MQASEIGEFTKQLTKHFELYPSAQMTQATTSAWWDELATLPFGAIPPALAKARAASPQFAPTCEQVRIIAEVEATRLRVLDAEKRAQRLLPPAESASKLQQVEQFRRACDSDLRSSGDGKVSDEDRPMIISLVVLLHRCYGQRDTAGMEEFGGWVWSDCKQRGFSFRSVVHGLRKVPDVCSRPPTMGMLQSLIRGEGVEGWPGRDDVIEPEAESQWTKLANYWAQENEHWAKHADARPEDANEQRFKQFWKMWDNVDKGIAAKKSEPAQEAAA